MRIWSPVLFSVLCYLSLASSSIALVSPILFLFTVRVCQKVISFCINYNVLYMPWSGRHLALTVTVLRETHIWSAFSFVDYSLNRKPLLASDVIYTLLCFMFSACTKITTVKVESQPVIACLKTYISCRLSASDAYVWWTLNGYNVTQSLDFAFHHNQSENRWTMEIKCPQKSHSGNVTCHAILPSKPDSYNNMSAPLVVYCKAWYYYIFVPTALRSFLSFVTQFFETTSLTVNSLF